MCLGSKWALSWDTIWRRRGWMWHFVDNLVRGTVGIQFTSPCVDRLSTEWTNEHDTLLTSKSVSLWFSYDGEGYETWMEREQVFVEINWRDVWSTLGSLGWMWVILSKSHEEHLRVLSTVHGSSGAWDYVEGNGDLLLGDVSDGLEMSGTRFCVSWWIMYDTGICNTGRGIYQDIPLCPRNRPPFPSHETYWSWCINVVQRYSVLGIGE